MDVIRTLALTLAIALLVLGIGAAQATQPLAPGAAASPEPAEFSGMVEAHNFWRRQANVPDLAWSDAATRQAQGWASQLAGEGCKLRFNPEESRRVNYGENLYYAYSAQAYEGWRRSISQVVARWGAEGEHYDMNTGQCSAPLGKGCGQYTQLVWEDTRYVGCARARCPAAEVWVCNYTPRGNVEGMKPARNPPPQPVAAAAPVLQCFAVGEDYPPAP